MTVREIASLANEHVNLFDGDAEVEFTIDGKDAWVGEVRYIDDGQREPYVQIDVLEDAP